jgi:hypothetical protein
MINEVPQSVERIRSALTTLSTVGAAVAGAGVGALLSSALAPVAWGFVAVGVISHLLGMVGVRRLLSSAGYQIPAWQRFGYWLCWAAIGAIALYALREAIR